MIPALVLALALLAVGLAPADTTQAPAWWRTAVALGLFALGVALDTTLGTAGELRRIDPDVGVLLEGLDEGGQTAVNGLAEVEDLAVDLD